MEFRGDKYFTELTSKERAAFELGIKLGTLYHSATGMPLKKDPNVLTSIAKGLESSIGCQPFVEKIKVEFDQAGLLANGFNYGEIAGRNLRAEIAVKYKDALVIGQLAWRKDLHYPLMSISKIETNRDPKP